MMGCAKYWYSWDADNTDERRLAQILLISSKINLRSLVYFVLSASSDIKLTHPRWISCHCPLSIVN